MIADETRLKPVSADKGHSDHPGGHAAHPHESPATMTGVLAVLAVLSIIGGWVGIPFGLLGIERETWFQRWLEPVLAPIGGHPFHFHHASMSLDWSLTLLSVAVAVFGIWLARKFYGLDPRWSIPERFAKRYPVLYRVVYNKYYVDELYQKTVISGTIAFGRVMSWIDTNIVDGLVNLVRHFTVIVLGHGSSLFDRFVVDGTVNGIAAGAKDSSTLIRRAQTGMVQNYLLVMGGGVVVLVAVYLLIQL